MCRFVAPGLNKFGIFRPEGTDLRLEYCVCKNIFLINFNFKSCYFFAYGLS